jgi:hypothetical protein
MKYNSEKILVKIQHTAALREDGIKQVVMLQFQHKSLRFFLIGKITQRYNRRIKTLEQQYAVALDHEKK